MVDPERSRSTGELRLQHLLAARLPPGAEPVAQLRIVTGQDSDRQQRRIRGARLPDRQSRNRNSLRHLHDGKQRIDALQASRGNGTASTGRMVLEASIPGKCAAPPAPAMMIFNPRGSACSA